MYLEMKLMAFVQPQVADWLDLMHLQAAHCSFRIELDVIMREDRAQFRIFCSSCSHLFINSSFYCTSLILSFRLDFSTENVSKMSYILCTVVFSKGTISKYCSLNTVFLPKAGINDPVYLIKFRINSPISFIKSFKILTAFFSFSVDFDTLMFLCRDTFVELKIHSRLGSMNIECIRLNFQFISSPVRVSDCQILQSLNRFFQLNSLFLLLCSTFTYIFFMIQIELVSQMSQRQPSYLERYCSWYGSNMMEMQESTVQIKDQFLSIKSRIQARRVLVYSIKFWRQVRYLVFVRGCLKTFSRESLMKDSNTLFIRDFRMFSEYPQNSLKIWYQLISLRSFSLSVNTSLNPFFRRQKRLVTSLKTAFQSLMLMSLIAVAFLKIFDRKNSDTFSIKLRFMHKGRVSLICLKSFVQQAD